MKILEFHERINQIMKIITFHTRIKKNHKNHKIPYEKKRKSQNIRSPLANDENHEDAIFQIENH